MSHLSPVKPCDKKRGVSTGKVSHVLTPSQTLKNCRSFDALGTSTPQTVALLGGIL